MESKIAHASRIRYRVCDIAVVDHYQQRGSKRFYLFSILIMHQKFYRIFLLSFLLLGVLQSLSVRGRWLPYQKGASNFFSSTARAQAGLVSNAPIALLGSSIAGRIPGVESGNSLIANFGVDGNTFQQGLKWIKLKEKPYAMIIIETNMIHGISSEHRLDSIPFWQKMGIAIPEAAAYARPSARIYSMLRNKNDHFDANKSLIPLPQSSKQQGIDLVNYSATSEQKNLLGLLMNWKKQGSEIVFVEFPSGERSKNSYPQRKPWIAWLSQNLDAPFYDFSCAIYHKSFTLSDGVHLDQKSAIIFANTLSEIYHQNSYHE
jgi:hypothetical protein